MGFSATACLGPRALMLKATYFIRFPVGSHPFIIDDAGRLFWGKKRKKEKGSPNKLAQSTRPLAHCIINKSMPK